MGLESNYKFLYQDFTPKDLSKAPEDKRESAISRNKLELMNKLLGSAPDKDKGKLKNFLAKTCNSDALGKYLFDNFELSSEAERRSRDDNILNEFQKLTAKYGYFDAQNALHIGIYKRCYDICEHTARFTENNYRTGEVASRAFKMMALFSPEPLQGELDTATLQTCRNIEKFMGKNVKTNTPIHDTLMHNLPEYHPNTPEFNLPGWKGKLQEFGLGLVRNFSDVPKIEGIIKADTSLSENNPDGLPHNKNSFDYLLSRAIYPRYDENPEFGKIFKSYNAPEEMFNRALDLMRDGTLKVDASGKGLLPKADDKIPDIALKVPGKDLYLVKLPSHDPRALILGEITGCCQSVSGDSEKCVIDGVNLPNNGFYVFLREEKGCNPSFNPNAIDWGNLEQKAKIVGQSYVWLGKDGALTLDSLEVLGSFRDKINVKDTMEALGKELSQKHQEIPRITLGMGGGTGDVLGAPINKDHGLQEAPSPESMKEGYMYGDSKEQYEVYVSESTKAARVSFSEKIQDIDNNIITSQAQSELLIAFSQKHPDMNLNDIPQPLLKDHVLKEIKYDPSAVQQIYSDILSAPLRNREPYAKGHEKGWWKIPNLLNSGLSEEMILSLTSMGAMEIYETGITTFDELRDSNMTPKKIAYLTWRAAQQFYHEGVTTFADLSKIDDENKIFALTVPNVRITCRAAGVPFAELVKIDDLEKIEALTSEDAQNAYKLGVPFDELVKINGVEKIQTLTSCAALDAYRARVTTFAELRDLDCTQELIWRIASYSAQEIYKAKFTTFAELAKINDIKKIEALTSPYALNAYKLGVPFAELAKLDEINIITSTLNEKSCKDFLKRLESKRLPVDDSYVKRLDAERSKVKNGQERL